ncbi:hypothetical protein MR060_06150 [bacterium]|nr:hypothetical protein [bacterium]
MEIKEKAWSRLPEPLRKVCRGWRAFVKEVSVFLDYPKAEPSCPVREG